MKTKHLLVSLLAANGLLVAVLVAGAIVERNTPRLGA